MPKEASWPPPQETASYIIFKDGVLTKAKNGSTGDIQFSNANSSTVIQAAIDVIGVVGGGSIYIKYGTYIITSKILIEKSHISINADVGTTFSSSLLPCFEIYGNGMDNLGRGGIAGGPPVNDIQVKNIRFLYTGPVANGNFVWIHEIQNDKQFQGAMLFDNIIITSTQIIAPVNTDFIGLALGDVIGLNFRYLSVAWFGTGILYLGTIWQGSHNVYSNVMVGQVSVGVKYSQPGTCSCELWQSLKVMFFTTFGFTDNMASPMTLINPQFESFTGATAINFVVGSGASISVVDGVFSSGLVGIKLYGSNGFLIGNSFGTLTTGIIVDTSSAFLEGNIYTAVGTKVQFWLPDSHIVSFLDGFVYGNTVLSPAFAIDGVALVTVTIPHGLSVTPAIEDCSLTVLEVTNVDDWGYNLLKVDNVGAVNVVAKVNVSVASATGGATAKLSLRVGKG